MVKEFEQNWALVTIEEAEEELWVAVKVAQEDGTVTSEATLLERVAPEMLKYRWVHEHQADE